jgi:DNA-binding FadR family transcriptional regulator
VDADRKPERLGLVFDSALGAIFEHTASPRGDIGRTLPEHDRIRTAIIGGGPAGARAAVRQLLGQTREIVDRLTAFDARRAKASNR